ncbi:cation diffusion facilitator family transporter [Oscillospiraceae bacterium OttesenSCG-928-G22]|nr:cation diffusion facilitator family transporter [Oscillospiraceae bacterium OttesenSCG-928-G22]
MEHARVESRERYRELRRVSIVTIIANAILCAAKLLIGFIAGSVSVISDGVHTLSDVGTTVVVLFGLYFSKDEADSDHPYGHERIESAVSLLLGVFLGATAVFIGAEGTRKLVSGEEAAPSVLALLITIVSIAVKEWMFRYTLKRAKRLDSLSLAADAWHHRTDAVSSIAVLVGVGGNMLGFWVLEPLAAIAVAILILKAAIDILKDALKQLVDHSVRRETYDELMELIQSVEGVRSVDLMRTRISGNVVFVDVDIAVDPRLEVRAAHAIAENVHDIVEAAPLKVRHCMVHVNPYEEGKADEK